MYISNVVNEIFTEQQEKPEVEEWQDLEFFWGLEKQRIQEGAKTLSSSLEELFSQENFLEEPQTEDDFKVRHIQGRSVAIQKVSWRLRSIEITGD